MCPCFLEASAKTGLMLLLTLLLLLLCNLLLSPTQRVPWTLPLPFKSALASPCLRPLSLLIKCSSSYPAYQLLPRQT